MKAKMQLSLVAAATLLLSNTASAQLFTFNDTWNDWPGYVSSSPNNDMFGGQPDVKNIQADIDVQAGLLKKVIVNYNWASRIVFDTLFINTSYAPLTDPSWDDWDYMLRDNGQSNSMLYTVDNPSGYAYEITNNPGFYRSNTPFGIDTNDLTPSNLLYTITMSPNGRVLTYDFGQGLSLAGGFFVAYSPFCGNDVLGGGNPVPEPTTMLLFGSGIAGLAAFARRKTAQ